MMTQKRIANLCATIVTLAASGAVHAQDQESAGNVRIIQPDASLSELRIAAIDTERFELGFFTGSLSVEDFGSNLLSGIELSYHLTPDWLLQFNYGQSQVERAAFETRERQFLSSKDRNFEYASFTGAYRIVKGRSFLGERNKYDSSIYALVGPDRVRFAGNSEWGWTFGLSYRVVFTDWLTSNLDIREHVFERDFIGDSKRTMNTEVRIGINALF